MEPGIIWLSLIWAFSVVLFSYRWSVQPSLRRARLESAVEAFGKAIELRFPNHGGLTDRVAKLAQAVGERLGFGPRRLQRLQIAIGLRDIGLCAIPFRLVNHRKWTDWTLPEIATYDCHSDVGGAILETIPALAEYAETVREHHESYVPGEGRRKPRLEARIVKVCAEFTWYRRHLGHQGAIQRLKEGSGVNYDPLVVEEVIELTAGTDAMVHPS